MRVIQKSGRSLFRNKRMSYDDITKGEKFRRMALLMLDIKHCEIAKELNISRSLVTKIIIGERKNPEFDSWFVNKILNVDE